MSESDAPPPDPKRLEKADANTRKDQDRSAKTNQSRRSPKKSNCKTTVTYRSDFSSSSGDDQPGDPEIQLSPALRRAQYKKTDAAVENSTRRKKVTQIEMLESDLDWINDDDGSSDDDREYPRVPATPMKKGAKTACSSDPHGDNLKARAAGVMAKKVNSGKDGHNNEGTGKNGTQSKQAGKAKQKLVVVTEEEEVPQDVESGVAMGNGELVLEDSAEHDFVADDAVEDGNMENTNTRSKAGTKGKASSSRTKGSKKAAREIEDELAEQCGSEEKNKKQTKKTGKPESGSTQQPETQDDESPVLTIKLPPKKAVTAKCAAKAIQKPVPPKRRSPRSHGS